MAIAKRTLTGNLKDLIGVPYRDGRVQAWIRSSKAVVVDGADLYVGESTPLILNGSSGAFSIDLPDSSEAGVLYSIHASWIDGNGRQVASRRLGNFELTANRIIGEVIETEAGDIPQTMVDQMIAQIEALYEWAEDLPPGPEGPQGPAGPSGPAGPAGADGAGVAIQGTLSDPDDLPGTGAPGQAWMVDGDMWVWSTLTDSWDNQGPIRGPEGPAGPAGPAGSTGAQGPAGIAGPQGTAGPTGAAGAGVPAGGTEGQVLAKTSGADHATAWVDPPEGGGGGVSTDPDGIGYLDLTGGGISPTPDDNGYLDL